MMNPNSIQLTGFTMVLLATVLCTPVQKDVSEAPILPFIATLDVSQARPKPADGDQCSMGVSNHMASWNTAGQKEGVTERVCSPLASDTAIPSGIARNLELFPLQSKGQKVTFQLDAAENLVVVRKQDNSVLWRQVVQPPAEGVRTHINTWSPGAMATDSDSASDVDDKTLLMKADGNLILYGPDNIVYWESGTSGNPGAELRLQDDGCLCVFANNRCVWSNGKRLKVTCKSKVATRPPSRSPTTRGMRTSTRERMIATPTVTRKDHGKIALQSGQKLTLNHGAILSPGETVGLEFLLAEGDRETLSVFRKCDRDVLWSPKLWGNENGSLELMMQADGDLALYNIDNHQQYWATNTHAPGAVLKLFNDGLLCVYNDGKCLWSTQRIFTWLSCSDDEEI